MTERLRGRGRTIDRAWVRASLSGPVAAVHPGFQRDGSLDFEGLARTIEHNLAAGTRTLLLTFGDSLHSILTDHEVGELLRAVIEIGAGRAMVVAADRTWWTGKEAAFAAEARDAGADVLMVLPPTWGGSVTADSLLGHYRTVAREIPIMLVTNLFATNEQLGLEVIARLLDEEPGVVAIKDDVAGQFARRMASMVDGAWAVLSGGQKQNHLDLLPYGVDGYLSTFINFVPDVPRAYWAAVTARDLALAARIVAAFDRPWFDFARDLPGGFDAMHHAAAEIFGLYGRWRRGPYHSATDEQIERLREFLSNLPTIDSVVAV